uniref:Putative ovule protein n=1 Tax=Solanum chacoense TaxID=4108 RepID=A0A0V0HBE9_SOLCH
MTLGTSFSIEQQKGTISFPTFVSNKYCKVCILVPFLVNITSMGYNLYLLKVGKVCIHITHYPLQTPIVGL